MPKVPGLGPSPQKAKCEFNAPSEKAAVIKTGEGESFKLPDHTEMQSAEGPTPQRLRSRQEDPRSARKKGLQSNNATTIQSSVAGFTTTIQNAWPPSDDISGCRLSKFPIRKGFLTACDNLQPAQ